jgi:hypothetical protein
MAPALPVEYSSFDRNPVPVRTMGRIALRTAKLLGLVVAAAALAGACADSGTPERSAAAPLLRASGSALAADPATGAELRRSRTEPLPVESEGPAAFAVERRTAGEGFGPVPGAERALAAAVLDGGRAIWVADGDGRSELRLVDGAATRTLDIDVLPELAVSPDGRRVLYARLATDGAELVLADPGTGERRVLYAGPTADRPVFRDDGRAFAFVGTGDGGFAALFVAEEGAPARQLTNVGLRTGRGLPPGFVPPPLDVAGTTFTRDELAWDAPSGRCRLALPSGEARCAGESP